MSPVSAALEIGSMRAAMSTGTGVLRVIARQTSPAPREDNATQGVKSLMRGMIATIPMAIEDGKRYSVYLSGFYNTVAKTSDGFIVEDPVPPAIDFTVARS